MKELKDVIALIPTPLTDNGEVDEKGLRKVIDFEVENGCHGVGVLAAIGEAYLFSRVGWRKVVEISVRHLNGKSPLMVGCPSMGTLPAMELYREAEDMGADAILAFNPQGFRSYSVKELIDHYLALTSAVKIHVAPYARGEDPIAFEVMKKLVDKGRVSYMKYAWRNPALLKEIAENIGDKLYIFCGADTFTLRYLLLGCKGVLTATAAILPKEHVELLAMVRKGRVEDARALYNDMITPWNDIGFYEMTVWQSVHKMALYHMGLIDSIKVVPPQSPADSYHADEVKFFLKRQGKLRRQ